MNPVKMNEEITALALEMTQHKKEVHAYMKEQETIAKEKHKALWDKIHETYDETDIEKAYTLDCEYAEQGIVMLSEKEKCEHEGMPEELKQLLASLG